MKCMIHKLPLLWKFETLCVYTFIAGTRQVSGYGVAFTAYLDHVETELGTEQTIIFNQALLNEGRPYSVNTGTCVLYKRVYGEFLNPIFIACLKVLVIQNEAPDVFTKMAEYRDCADKSELNF